MKIGFLIDPLATLQPHKDSTFAMLLAAQQRHHNVFTLTANDLWLQDGICWARLTPTQAKTNTPFFELGEPTTQPLAELDVVLLRKDPPFNIEYIYLTYLLEIAQSQGVAVFNNPSSVRDANEKLFATHFPQCCPSLLVSRDTQLLKEFIHAEQSTVIKPLDGMGGQSIFKLNHDDPNLNVILDTITNHQQKTVMVQRYLHEISEGDKRILLIDGQPVPYALARIPPADDFRGNLAAGATAEGRELTERDLWICEEIGPTLQRKGLVFVGIDIIGNYLTEINVTSPTGIRELDQLYDLNIAGTLIQHIEQHLNQQH